MTCRRLGPRFVDAVAWAVELHGDQCRKGTTVPYLTHLLAVAAYVLEDGGGEDEAIAALLHDAVEDTPVEVEDVGRRFGPEVAGIVQGCTEPAVPGGRGPETWDARKQAYLEHLQHPAVPISVLRVAAADKLHNARGMVAALRAGGDAFWANLNAPRERQVWLFRSLADLLAARLDGHYLARELEAAVAEMVRLGQESASR